MYKILIIEDDKTIAETTAEHLRRWDYDVDCIDDFKNVMSGFESAAPQLVLIDIMLPFFNGFHWCNEIRKISKVPIVFVSSASENMNIVMAMNMGGDDFVEKPFDLNVLTAKVQALLRRTYSFQGQISILEHKGVMLSIHDATVTYKDKKLELTRNDYKILHLLMEQPGNIVTREEIMERLWKSDEYIDDNTLTVNVTRLRKHLEEIGITGFIVTRKGVGYLVE